MLFSAPFGVVRTIVRCMKTFEINGTTLVGEQKGSGETLVFVHGAVGDFRTWENQVDEFATRYQVISYSRRWHHPQSCSVNATSYTPDIHIADLLSLLRQIGPAHLVSHSYGAAISSVVAIQEPRLVRSLVLAEPSLFSLLVEDAAASVALQKAFGRVPHLTSLIANGNYEAALDDFLEVILGDKRRDLSSRAREVMLANLHTLLPMLNGMLSSSPFTSTHAAMIRVPTLLISGEHTPIFFRRTLEILKAAIPRAEHVMLPGISHGLHLEDPVSFRRAAFDFLSKLELVPAA